MTLDATLSRFLRYVVTGGTAALVDLGGFMLLVHVTGVIAAATSSFLVALVVNFLLSARFAFGTAVDWRRFVLFALFAALGLLINVSVTVVAATGLDLYPALAKTAGIGIAFLFNFSANHFLVFAARQRS